MLDLHHSHNKIPKYETVDVPMECIEQVGRRIKDLLVTLNAEGNPRKIGQIEKLLEINKAVLARMNGVPWLSLKLERNKDACAITIQRKDNPLPN